MQGTPSPRETSSPGRPQEQSLRILLAEDQPADGRFLATTLAKAGYEVTLECNAQQVFDWMAYGPDGRSKFDLVILDLSLHQFEVISIAHRLRSTGCQIPIMAITDGRNESVTQQCLEVGCDAHLTKPVSKEQLFYEVGRFLLPSFRQRDVRVHTHFHEGGSLHGQHETSGNATAVPHDCPTQPAQSVSHRPQ